MIKWDLGEFSQKGTVRTRWGTKEELLSACSTAKANGVNIIVDAILNVSERFNAGSPTERHL